VAGAAAPRAAKSTGAAVVVAGPGVTGDAAGGVVFAAGGPLRFGSTGAVLVTAACARLADDVAGAAAGVCVAAGTSGPAAWVLVAGCRPWAAWAVTGASGCPAVGEAVWCPVGEPAAGCCGDVPVAKAGSAAPAAALRTVPDALVADCPGAPADGTSAAPAPEPETELVVSAEAVPAAGRAALLT
jgi:hypothetical protein